jgi:hypothetical protein
VMNKPAMHASSLGRIDFLEGNSISSLHMAPGTLLI